MVLLMRSAGDPHQLIDPLREVVRALDANLPMSDVRTQSGTIKRVGHPNCSRAYQAWLRHSR